MEPSWTNWRKWDRLTWLLIAITAAGIFLRFYKIDYYGLWLDESATIWFSNHSFYEIFNLTAQGEYNPPLFYWIEHVVMYFGTNEFTMRLVPAICGCLTIPVFYKIGERLKDRSVGVMMAALLAFSPFAIFYSQEARTYSLTLLIMAVMFLWYLKAQSNFDWIMIGVLGALAFWSHFFSILFFGVILLWEFTQTWELKPPVLSGAVFVGLTTPITLVTISLFGLRTSSPPTYGVQGLEVIKETALQFSGFNLWAMFAFLVLFVLGIFWLSINDKKLTLMIYTILAITFGISIYLSYMLPILPRYVMWVLPFFYVGIACSMKWIKWKRQDVLTGLFVVLVILLAILPMHQYYFEGEAKDNWRAVASDLTNLTNDGDWVLSTPWYQGLALKGYYDFASDHTVDLSEQNSLRYVQENPHDKTFIIVSQEDTMWDDPTGDTWKWINESSTPIVRYGRVEIRVRN